MTQRSNGILWFSRIVLALGTLILTLVAVKYIAHPVQTAAASGIVLTTPLANTDVRVGFGAFPLGFALLLLWSLSAKRVAVGLRILAVSVGVALAMRFYGVIIDHTFAQSLPVLIAESVLFTLAIIAISLDRSPIAYKPESLSP